VSGVPKKTEILADTISKHKAGTFRLVKFRLVVARYGRQVMARPGEAVFGVAWFGRRGEARLGLVWRVELSRGKVWQARLVPVR